MVAEDSLRLCGHITVGSIHKSELELRDPERERSMLISGPVELWGSMTVMRRQPLV